MEASLQKLFGSVPENTDPNLLGTVTDSALDDKDVFDENHDSDNSTNDNQEDEPLFGNPSMSTGAIIRGQEVFSDSSIRSPHRRSTDKDDPEYFSINLALKSFKGLCHEFSLLVKPEWEVAIKRLFHIAEGKRRGVLKSQLEFFVEGVRIEQQTSLGKGLAEVLQTFQTQAGVFQKIGKDYKNLQKQFSDELARGARVAMTNQSQLEELLVKFTPRIKEVGEGTKGGERKRQEKKKKDNSKIDLDSGGEEEEEYEEEPYMQAMRIAGFQSRAINDPRMGEYFAKFVEDKVTAAIINGSYNDEKLRRFKARFIEVVKEHMKKGKTITE